MHPVVRAVHRYLSTPITVIARPAQFAFICAAKHVDLEPTVYISQSTGRIIGVGAGVSPTESYHVTRLFEPDSRNSARVGKFSVLEAFFRYGFALCRNGTVMLRPVVTIHGAETLASVTGGYHEYLLNSAAQSAGALECLFERAA